jgi:hypothetical protein
MVAGLGLRLSINAKKPVATVTMRNQTSAMRFLANEDKNAQIAIPSPLWNSRGA